MAEAGKKDAYTSWLRSLTRSDVVMTSVCFHGVWSTPGVWSLVKGHAVSRLQFLDESSDISLIL